MNILARNLKLFTMLFLSGALIFLYPISILSMDHGNTMQPNHQVQHGSMNGQSLASHMPMADSEECVAFHLNMLQKLTSSQQTNAGIILFGAFILTLVLLASGGIKQILDYLQTLLLLRYQRLRSVSLETFRNQLGNWLAIIEKKSPSYAFTIA
jgi:hypothetical protein